MEVEMPFRYFFDRQLVRDDQRVPQAQATWDSVIVLVEIDRHYSMGHPVSPGQFDGSGDLFR
jgi:hypothetical protein